MDMSADVDESTFEHEVVQGIDIVAVGNAADCCHQTVEDDVDNNGGAFYPPQTCQDS